MTAHSHIEAWVFTLGAMLCLECGALQPAECPRHDGPVTIAVVADADEEDRP